MYQPSKETLNKYANVLINFALNAGKGVKKGDVVLLQVPECAKPLLVSLRNTVLKAGAHPIVQYLPDDMQREFYSLANENQLSFFPEKYQFASCKRYCSSSPLICTLSKSPSKKISVVPII